MSTQYASLSIIRWRPCTCPSIRRSRPRALAFVSSLIMSEPPGGIYPLGVVSTRVTVAVNSAGDRPDAERLEVIAQASDSEGCSAPVARRRVVGFATFFSGFALAGWGRGSFHPF